MYNPFLWMNKTVGRRSSLLRKKYELHEKQEKNKDGLQKTSLGATAWQTFQTCKEVFAKEKKN